MNTPISALLDRKGAVLHTAAPAETVAAVVARMNRHHIGSVLVLDGAKLTGIFTERDVLRRVVGAGLDPNGTVVADVMTRQVLTVTPATTLDQAVKIFTEKRCRHLPVIESGELRGLVSIGDVTRWLSEAHRVEAEQLKNYIAGGVPT
ncbi:MAG: CBS domain-containing protein [Verrucomicrobia bacterium]|nr:CBS domain-containing protein [Verrucomicrobiota bacterium]